MSYLIDIFRSSIYIWVCFEALLNIFVYTKGYKNRQTNQSGWNSPIIMALILIMFSICIASVYLFVCSIIRVYDRERYMALTQWVFLFYFPIGIALDKFREHSLCNPEELKKELKK